MNNNIEAPIVTILGNVETRTITDKKGFAKPVHGQAAQIETPKMRMQFEVEHDTPEKAYPIGAKFYWDVTEDLVPGQYGRIELARKKTLRPLAESKPAAKAVA